MNGCYEVAQMLINAGADVNAQDKVFFFIKLFFLIFYKTMIMLLEWSITIGHGNPIQAHKDCRVY